MDIPEFGRLPKQSTPEDMKKPNVGEIAEAVRVLLESKTIESETDRRIVAEVSLFIAAPTEHFEDIARYASKIGEVMGGFYQQGREPPPEIEALNRQMQTLLIECHIRIARTEMSREHPDLTILRHSVKFAVDLATTFMKGYGDDSLRKEALELRGAMEQL